MILGGDSSLSTTHDREDISSGVRHLDALMELELHLLLSQWVGNSEVFADELDYDCTVMIIQPAHHNKSEK